MATLNMESFNTGKKGGGGWKYANSILTEVKMKLKKKRIQIQI